MSNKLKTISKVELEHFIAEKVSVYLDEDCSCHISNINTPYINSEEDVAETDKRAMTFDTEISYLEGD